MSPGKKPMRTAQGLSSTAGRRIDGARHHACHTSFHSTSADTLATTPCRSQQSGWGSDRLVAQDNLRTTRAEAAQGFSTNRRPSGVSRERRRVPGSSLCSVPRSMHDPPQPSCEGTSVEIANGANSTSSFLQWRVARPLRQRSCSRWLESRTCASL